jgi:hypothetical protein
VRARIAVTALLLSPVLGCADSSAPPAVSPTTPTAAAAGPAPAPLSTVLTTDPGEQQQIYAGASAAPKIALDAPGSASHDALETGLSDLATKAAPGMQPDGPRGRGKLAEKGHLVMSVSLDPGKCYAVLGFSPSGAIVDLDLHLLAPPFYNVLSGQDETDDNTPVIGRNPNPMCPVAKAGIPYKVDIFADKGAGDVVVQVFSKPH